MSELVVWAISCVFLGTCLGFLVGYVKGINDARQVPHD